MAANPKAVKAASWALDVEDRAERQRLINGHRSRRKPKYEDGYGGEDHTEADAWLIEQWQAATLEAGQ